MKDKVADLLRTVSGDFVRNLGAATPDEINRQLRGLQRSISAALKKTNTKVDNVLVPRLQTMNTALAKLATERDRIAASLEKATQTATDVADRARSTAALSTLSEDERATPEGIAAALHNRLRATDAFEADVERLQKRGLDKSLIE